MSSRWYFLMYELMQLHVGSSFLVILQSTLMVILKQNIDLCWIIMKFGLDIIF